VEIASGKRKLVPPRRQPEPGETALSVDPGPFPEPLALYKQLVSIAHYHTLDVGQRSAVRLPQPLQPAKLPGVDGEDLVSCLFSIRESDRDRFDLIEGTLHAGFHDFERLDFPPVAAGTLAMTWRDKRFSKPFYMHQLSEGVLRFLWLVTLLQSPGLPAVTLIDEPEVSLHPELLGLLADLLREASMRTQLIVATHADRLVRFLEPKEVVAMDLKEDGTTGAAWADTLDLDAWLKEYTLDEVWGMGRMGARS
jgi:predicted ATPase